MRHDVDRDPRYADGRGVIFLLLVALVGTPIVTIVLGYLFLRIFVGS